MPLVFDVATGEEVDLLVTVSDYRTLTGDTTSVDSVAENALLTAQRLVEEYLRRELSEKERTETLPLYSCKVYPGVTPLASTISGTISGTAITPDISITSQSFFGNIPQEDGTVDVTYIGGFTEETLPRTLQLAIAHTAKATIDGATINTDIPDGASSVAVGDVRISYRDTATTSKAGGLSQDVKDSIKRYRRQWV